MWMCIVWDISGESLEKGFQVVEGWIGERERDGFLLDLPFLLFCDIRKARR
jgi:hypothetical protein